jgi:hypothetical protein
MAASLVPLALLGEAGHVLLDQLNAGVAHHVFHLLFPLIAFAVFAAFVAHDVGKHGWPRFTWRLRQAPPGPPGPVTPKRCGA